MHTHNADRLNQDPWDMTMTEMATRKRAKVAAELEIPRLPQLMHGRGAREKRDATAEAAVGALRGWLKCQPFCTCGEARPCSMSKLFRCVTCADNTQNQYRKAAMGYMALLQGSLVMFI